MNKELIKIVAKPTIPVNWDYNKSVERVKTILYNWKNLTEEMANELWVAREVLNAQGQRTDLTSGQKFRSWTNYCQEIGSSRQVVNRWIKRWFDEPNLLTERKTTSLPKGKYNIIYADPPWKYWTGGFKNQSQHYNQMELEEICNLPITDLAADDCLLFMWTTFPMLDSFIDVLRCWGFEYSTVAFVWIKANKNSGGFFTGLGNWTRSNAEICVLGRRGKVERQDASISQIIYEPVGEHSVKPAITRNKIVQLVGDLPRIELFARQKTDGWDVWGDEI